MKKIILILISMILLIGCNSVSEKNFDYLNELNYEKISLTENYDDVLKLLPGNENIKESYVENNRLVVKYDTYIIWAERLESYNNYWEKDEIYKNILLFNAAILFSKNDSIDEIDFYIDTSSSVYLVYAKKPAFEDSIYKNFDLLRSDSTIIEENLKKALSEKNITGYYAVHPTLKLDKDAVDC